MIFRNRRRFENLDQYLAKRDYRAALEAIAEEIKRRPNNFNLLLRQAEVMALSGDRSQAVSVYETLARHFIGLGFYARAIAVANKIQKLDPSREDLSRQLAAEIGERQEAEKEERGRLHRASQAAPSKGSDPAAAPAIPDDIPLEQAEREQQASRLFDQFPPAALEELLSSTSVRNFAVGDTLVREGDPGASLFLIEDGEVEVRTADPAGRQVSLARLGPGEFFGEVSILTGLPRTATVVAVSASTVIEIQRTDIDAIATRHPRVREVLKRFYEERAQATVEAMVARVRDRDTDG